jgi:biopolymer transport protein ExbD
MSTYDRNTRKRKGTRQVRRKTEDVKGLSITSLLDVLTIILVFLIKNVSMDAVKLDQLPNMQYPTTITTEKLMDNAMVTPVKLYLHEVLMGVDNQFLGTPQDLVENVETRATMEAYLLAEMSQIPEDKWEEACLVVQADAAIPCSFITQIVSVGTSVGYGNVYFATIEDADWLRTYRSASNE